MDNKISHTSTHTSFTKIIREFSLHYFYQELSIKQNNHISPFCPKFQSCIISTRGQILKTAD